MEEKRESILIVDDEEVISMLLYRKLSRVGYQCLEAGGAEQALDVLRNSQVDLVVLDIKMPGKTGIELLPEIKADYLDVAVIMATATTDTDVAIQCMKQGAYDYLIKPFNFDQISISVERALEKRNLELELKEYRQHLEEKVSEQSRKIRESFINAIMALAYALEAKDKYTSGHSQRVFELATSIAREMGLPPASIDKLQLAALVHDIGKIGVRESILNKPGRLTDEEFRHVQKHSETGERILAPIADDEEILNLVRSHHEHYNGAGYPDQMKDKQISLGARILAVADSYAAMTSERPYREIMNHQAACDELERCRQTQFDGQGVDAFLRSKTRG